MTTKIILSRLTLGFALLAVSVLAPAGAAGSDEEGPAVRADYMHLAKFDGRWQIVHVLWQTHPESLEGMNDSE